jgi:hypothetical protein
MNVRATKESEAGNYPFDVEGAGERRFHTGNDEYTAP